MRGSVAWVRKILVFNQYRIALWVTGDRNFLIP